MDIDYVHGMYELSNIKSIIIRPNMHFALIACALFMMVSGATLKLNYNGNIINFYKKRLLRILVPFYIAYFKYAFNNSKSSFVVTLKFVSSPGIVDIFIP